MIVTIDLDPIKVKENSKQSSISLITDKTSNPHKSLENTSVQFDALALAKVSPMAGEEPTIPKWLETSVEKKRSLVPLSMPIVDLVSKFQGKPSKTKRTKTESRLNFDKNLRHQTTEIAMPPKGSSYENLTPQDYQVSRIDLRQGSHAIDMKNFEVSNKKIVDKVWKDTQDKQEMKEAM